MITDKNFQRYGNAYVASAKDMLLVVSFYNGSWQPWYRMSGMDEPKQHGLYGYPTVTEAIAAFNTLGDQTGDGGDAHSHDGGLMSETITVPTQALRNLVNAARYNVQLAKADLSALKAVTTDEFYHQGYQTGRVTELESMADLVDLLIKTGGGGDARQP